MPERVESKSLFGFTIMKVEPVPTEVILQTGIPTALRGSSVFFFCAGIISCRPGILRAINGRFHIEIGVAESQFGDCFRCPTSLA